MAEKLRRQAREHAVAEARAPWRRSSAGQAREAPRARRGGEAPLGKPGRLREHAVAEKLRWASPRKAFREAEARWKLRVEFGRGSI